jgi:hypothetical protein
MPVVKHTKLAMQEPPATAQQLARQRSCSWYALPVPMLGWSGEQQEKARKNCIMRDAKTPFHKAWCVTASRWHAGTGAA